MDKFTFGKHKGRPVTEVIKENPGYVAWCAENVSFFTLSVSQAQALEAEQVDREYDRYVRHLIKEYGMHATEAMDYIEYDMPEYY